ncbi:MAG: hypothetical protein K0S67_932, partial [Nitrososphaeraceae archaeon]|nr:hypothetical protein [Nitrososphaeraceae archaeon]
MSENSNRKNNGDKNLSKGDKGVRGDANITNAGDTARDITDTGDVSRASIAKGKGIQEDVTAA